MAKKLKLIKKFGLTPPPAKPKKQAAKAAGPPAVVATLELSVTKNGGPVATSTEVGSSGNDDRGFTDQQLTPGPVQMPLLKGNFYTVVWQGAFVKPGSATLHVKATNAGGGVFVQKSVAAKRPPLGKTFTLVVL